MSAIAEDRERIDEAMRLLVNVAERVGVLERERASFVTTVHDGMRVTRELVDNVNVDIGARYDLHARALERVREHYDATLGAVRTELADLAGDVSELARALAALHTDARASAHALEVVRDSIDRARADAVRALDSIARRVDALQRALDARADGDDDDNTVPVAT